MLFSSTAFHKDFDYDLSLAHKGEKVDYVEDYSDEWSQYMLGLAVKLNWIQFDKEKLGNHWTVVSVEEDGTTFKSETLFGTWK